MSQGYSTGISVATGGGSERLGATFRKSHAAGEGILSNPTIRKEADLQKVSIPQLEQVALGGIMFLYVEAHISQLLDVVAADRGMAAAQERREWLEASDGARFLVPEPYV